MIPLRDATPPRRTAVVTSTLILLCTIAFGWEVIVSAIGGDSALEQLVQAHGLVPADLVAALQGGNPGTQPFLDVFTSMFLHAGWLHLFGNMLYLWIFGNRVEDRLGRFWFPIVYLLGGVAAVAAHVLSDPTSQIPVIGASGAISAVLGAYLVLYPTARIQSLVFLGFFYQLIAVPAVLVLGFWFLLQLVDGIAALGASTAIGGGVAVWAHVGGFVAGLVLALPFRLRRPRVG